MLVTALAPWGVHCTEWPSPSTSTNVPLQHGCKRFNTASWSALEISLSPAPRMITVRALILEMIVPAEDGMRHALEAAFAQLGPVISIVFQLQVSKNH